LLAWSRTSLQRRRRRGISTANATSVSTAITFTESQLIMRTIGTLA
jgi:hypothetical protein